MAAYWSCKAYFTRACGRSIRQGWRIDPPKFPDAPAHVSEPWQTLAERGYQTEYEKMHAKRALKAKKEKS